MFTGIIEEVGMIRDIRKSEDQYQLSIGVEKVLEDINLGDSIAVNGACLTVTSFSDAAFTADIMPETLKSTSLGQLSKGHPVNIERAMPANGRFGGHFVSGHVDGTGEITSVQEQANAVYFWIKSPSSLLTHIIPKGSIALEGISLTVVEVTDTHFSVSVIPHTLSATNLSFLQVGDVVNLETDMLAKYIQRLTINKGESTSNSELTMKTLVENGFV